MRDTVRREVRYDYDRQAWVERRPETSEPHEWVVLACAHLAAMRGVFACYACVHAGERVPRPRGPEA